VRKTEHFKAWCEMQIDNSQEWSKISVAKLTNTDYYIDKGQE
jgi:hypothetical protein